MYLYISVLLEEPNSSKASLYHYQNKTLRRPHVIHAISTANKYKHQWEWGKHKIHVFNQIIIGPIDVTNSVLSHVTVSLH